MDATKRQGAREHKPGKGQSQKQSVRDVILSGKIVIFKNEIRKSTTFYPKVNRENDVLNPIFCERFE